MPVEKRRDPAKPGVASPAQDQPFCVVIVYDDRAACTRAIRMLATLAIGVGDDLEFQPLSWPFELLADAHSWAQATNDAVQADLLVVASSGTQSLPPLVERWIETALARKQGSPAAVIALLGPEANPDGAHSPRRVALQTVAEGAGLTFFAPSRPTRLDQDVAGIDWPADRRMPLLS